MERPDIGMRSAAIALEETYACCVVRCGSCGPMWLLRMRQEWGRFPNDYRLQRSAPWRMDMERSEARGLSLLREKPVCRRCLHLLRSVQCVIERGNFHGGCLGTNPTGVARCPVLFPWPPAYFQRRAGAGLRGLCETWMFRKSLQGRIHGAPRKPAPARQLRQTGGQRLFAQMHEATGRSPVPRYTMQSDTPKAIGAPIGPRCFGLYSEKPPQRRPVSLRAMTRRWISEVPS
ncbi:hypothetical protein QE447_001894 [Stenotrophomonas sp. SORGH_AS282]|nr:hypothetical protein [Stenotrophomonas sp. SORGH_AS_0282]MDQ1189391.1 hypothetical protein [Stenotrophomonas sp. SORGH_AS_0282]